MIIAVIILTVIVFGMVIFFAYGQETRSEPEKMRFENTMILEDKGEVKMIAHRGLSKITLENTIEAFEEAGKRSYYGIEADVHVTKDGKYIIVHDDDLNRIAWVKLVIEETDYDTLRALRFKDPYGKKEEKKFFLPSLEEYLAVCMRYEKQAILELKNEMSNEQVLGIAEAVEKLGWLEHKTFISFAGKNLVALRAEYPMADAQYLTQEWTEEKIQFIIDNKFDAALRWDIIDKYRVERLHKAGLKVNCWTVDEVSRAKAMIDCGVDFITSNILE